MAPTEISWRGNDRADLHFLTFEAQNRYKSAPAGSETRMICAKPFFYVFNFLSTISSVETKFGRIFRFLWAPKLRFILKYTEMAQLFWPKIKGEIVQF